MAGISIPSLNHEQLQSLLNNSNLDANSKFVISCEGGNVRLQKTGFLHSVKAFFGIGNARTQNLATLETLRRTILNDDGFALGYKKAVGMIKDVKGTITVDKMRQILNTAGGVDDVLGGTSAGNRVESLVEVAKGRLAATLNHDKIANNGEPLKFLEASDIPLNGPFKAIRKDFYLKYTNSIANAVKAQNCTNVDKMKQTIEDCKALYESMFKEVGEGKNQRLLIKFLSNCGGNTLLTEDENGVRLKTKDECIKFAKEMVNVLNDVQKYRNQSVYVLNILSNMDNTKPLPFSADGLMQIINIGRSIDTNKLSKLFDAFKAKQSWTKLPRPDQVTKALGDLYKAVSKAVDEAIQKDVIKLDKSIGDNVQRANEKIANTIKKGIFQVAINSMDPVAEAALGRVFVSDYAGHSFRDFIENADDNGWMALNALKTPMQFDNAVDIEHVIELNDKSTVKIDGRNRNDTIGGMNFGESIPGKILPDEE